MKFNKRLCFVISATFILIFTIITSKEIAKKNNITINYDYKYNVNNEDSKEVKVPASTESSEEVVKPMPVPNPHDPIVLDAL